MREPSLLETWIQRYEQTASRNRFLLEKFWELLHGLSQQNIEILPLKGMDLLLRGCSVPGSRPLSDIDILVREKDLSRIAEVLQARGFLLRPHSRNFLSDSFVNESFDYISPDRSLGLDVCWRMRYLDSMETLWNRVGFRQTLLGTCRLLHAGDALLYLMTYSLTQRGCFPPFFIQDLQGFLQKEGAQMDWKQWALEVKRCGMAEIIFCGISYAREKGLEEIPEEWFTTLQPRSLIGRFLVGYYSQTARVQKTFSSPAYLGIFFGAPGWKKKLELLKNAFFPSASFIELRRGKESAFLRLLAGVWRPVRILARILYFIPRDLIRILRK